MLTKAIIIIALSLLSASPSYGYLDPATGSMLLQGLLAIIATIITTLSLYWRKIKNVFSKIIKKPNGDESRN